MKKKLQFFLKSYLLILLISPISCNNCGPFPDRFKVVALDWEVYDTTYNNSTNELNLSEIIQNSLVYSNFSIFIRPERETYFSMKTNKNAFTFISTAYACDPVLPTTTDRIEKIEIFSNTNYNANYPINTDLSNIFDIVINNSEYAYEKYDLNTYLATNPIVPNEFTLLLKESPDLTLEHQFTVKYYQNGVAIDYFEFTTNLVEIRRN